MAETPEGCFYDLLLNNRELFTEQCGFELPAVNSPEDYLKNGPSFIILLHPALGPLYSIIAQKIRKGRLAPKSELQLEIAELDISDLNLDGSLVITADEVMGNRHKGLIQYSPSAGKCVLHHVKVKNQGIDFAKTHSFWKNQMIRKESLTIHLIGNGEFFAENVTFTGNHHIEVPAGHRMIAYQENGEVKFQIEKISGPTWHWHYAMDQNRISLTKSSDLDK